MGSELYVSPIALSSFCSARLRLPCSGSLGPRFPTFPVCSTVSDSRYYAPLRLPEARLATLRSSLRVAIPCLLLLVLCVPSHSARCAARGASAQRQVSFLRQTLFPVFEQGDNRLSQVPVLPSRHMPCSRTPVVFPALALARQKLLPSTLVTVSAFPSFR